MTLTVQQLCLRFHSGLMRGRKPWQREKEEKNRTDRTYGTDRTDKHPRGGLHHQGPVTVRVFTPPVTTVQCSPSTASLKTPKQWHLSQPGQSCQKPPKPE